MRHALSLTPSPCSVSCNRVRIHPIIYLLPAHARGRRVSEHDSIIAEEQE